jgi:transmembrane sensor
MDEERDRYSDRRRDADVREAANWFARWQSGTVDESEFARWRDADPAHALAFARVAAAWEGVGEGTERPARSPLFTRRRIMAGGIAGAVIATTGTGLIATRAYAWERASTAIGESRKIRLPDNSMAALNTDTSLFWRFSVAKRELWLERGEVALDLQRGPVARLRTESSHAALSDGRFNARLKQAALELTVFRGQASAQGEADAAAAKIDVAAYQHVSFAGSAPVVRPISNMAVEAALAWQSGDIVFYDTPLSEAAAEYNRYLLRKIVIDDPSVGAIRVGGRFTAADPSDFLRAISISLGVRVHSTAAGHHLGG